MATSRVPTHVVLERSHGPAQFIGVKAPMKGITWDDFLPKRLAGYSLESDPQLRRVPGDVVRMTLLYANGDWTSFNVLECPEPLHGALWGGLGPRFARQMDIPRLPPEDTTYASYRMVEGVASPICYPIDNTWWCPSIALAAPPSISGPLPPPPPPTPPLTT